MRICVIYKGISSEKEVSINTAKQIIEGLDKSKYEVLPLEINEKKDILKIKDMDVDFAYIALHGKYGEDGTVQAVLDMLDIPYAGAGMLASAICMDKDITKTIVNKYGVRTAKWWFVRKGGSMNYPSEYRTLVVKPNSGGSSIGVSFVCNQSELDEALNKVYLLNDDAIVEEALTNSQEYSVPIIDGKIYPIVKIEALAGSYFDYASKYQDNGAREFVVELDDKLASEINEFAKKVYEYTRCRGFARADFLVKEGLAYFMEINTLPGMTKNSILPKSTKSVGYSFEKTLDLLINSSIK